MVECGPINVNQRRNGHLVRVETVAGHYWTSPRSAAASCSASHASTIDFFQTRRLFDYEQRKLELSDDASMESRVPQDGEAQP